MSRTYKDDAFLSRELRVARISRETREKYGVETVLFTRNVDNTQVETAVWLTLEQTASLAEYLARRVRKALEEFALAETVIDGEPQS